MVEQAGIYQQMAAAQSGDVQAQHDCGVHYLSQGTRDIGRSEYWFRKAAEKGYVPAQTALGYVLQTFLQREDEAVIWLRRAAAKGHSEASFRLGIHCICKGSVNDRKGQGIDYLESAALDQHIGAQLLLAHCLLLGVDSSASPRASYRWLRMAATQGDGRARLTLAWIYEQGWGVEADEIIALACYKQAPSFPFVERHIERLTEHLDDQALRLAEQLSLRHDFYPETAPKPLPLRGPVWLAGPHVQVEYVQLFPPLLCIHWLHKFHGSFGSGDRAQKAAMVLNPKALNVQVLTTLKVLQSLVLQPYSDCKSVRIHAIHSSGNSTFKKGHTTIQILLNPGKSDRVQGHLPGTCRIIKCAFDCSLPSTKQPGFAQGSLIASLDFDQTDDTAQPD